MIAADCYQAVRQLHDKSGSSQADDIGCAGSAVPDLFRGQKPDFEFYGCDGINATSVGGYQSVFASNIYGSRIDAHFHCGHNISNDPKLLMTIKAIKGVSIDELLSLIHI